ncbi:MAG: hypothetical protein MPW17_15430 [Candidatus Manganitrophus sp.]|nr:MAG: hypothetical protein MPW17_15430 [Candidatus Manganitrophus sp.]
MELDFFFFDDLVEQLIEVGDRLRRIGRADQEMSELLDEGGRDPKRFFLPLPGDLSSPPV